MGAGFTRLAVQQPGNCRAVVYCENVFEKTLSHLFKPYRGEYITGKLKISLLNNQNILFLLLDATHIKEI